MKTTLRYLFWGTSGFCLGLLVYIASSGPVLATASWLVDGDGTPQGSTGGGCGSFAC